MHLRCFVTVVKSVFDHLWRGFELSDLLMCLEHIYIWILSISVHAIIIQSPKLHVNASAVKFNIMELLNIKLMESTQFGSRNFYSHLSFNAVFAINNLSAIYFTALYFT